MITQVRRLQANDATVQMIDTPIVRARQHPACIAGNSEKLMGRS
jgi:hypothetical protein